MGVYNTKISISPQHPKCEKIFEEAEKEAYKEITPAENQKLDQTRAQHQFESTQWVIPDTTVNTKRLNNASTPPPHHIQQTKLLTQSNG